MNHVIGSLTNSKLYSLSYSNSIYKNNLDYGVVGMATLSLEASSPLSSGSEYDYYVDSVKVGEFVCKSVNKNGDKYSITLYDRACELSSTERQTYEEDDEHFCYYGANGTIVDDGTYDTSGTATTYTDAEYYDATIGMTATSGYYPISISTPYRKGLTFGDKISVGEYIGYVQGISWDLDKYTITSQTTEEDNAESQIEQVEDSIIQQGTLITSLTTEVGKVEAKVERKNSVFKQSTVPADTDGTNVDLLYTGDLWYCTTNIPSTEPYTYKEGKWYACTATGTTAAGKRSVTWTETTDATISENSAKIEVEEQKISAVVKTSGSTYAPDAVKIINAINNESGVKIDESKVDIYATEEKVIGIESGINDINDEIGSDTETETLKGRITTNATNITAKVSKTVTKPSGTTESGTYWDLDENSWSVHSYSNVPSSSKDVEVLKVDSSGLTVNGSGTFSGTLSAATGSFSGTVTASAGKIGCFNIDTNNNDRLVCTSSSVMSGIVLNTTDNKDYVDMEAGEISLQTTNANSVRYNSYLTPSSLSVSSNSSTDTNTFTFSGNNGNFKFTSPVAVSSYGENDPSGTGIVGQLYFKIES